MPARLGALAGWHPLRSVPWRPRKGARAAPAAPPPTSTPSPQHSTAAPCSGSAAPPGEQIASRRRQPHVRVCAMWSGLECARVQMLLCAGPRVQACPELTSCACRRRQVLARAARRWAAGCPPPLQGPPAARLAAALCPQHHRLGLLPLRRLGCLPVQGLLAAAGAAAAAAGALLLMAALHHLPHPGTALHRLLRPVAAGWRSTAPA